MPQTPATSHHQLKRSASQETLATTMSEVSSTPSLACPGAPANTPATQSLVGDMAGETIMSMSVAADIDVAAGRLCHASSSPSTPGVSYADDDPFKEGKAPLRSHLHNSGEEANLHQALFKSPTPKRPMRKHEMLKKYVLGPAAEDRSATPTHLSFVTRAPAAQTPQAPASASATFENSTWSAIAEEDTQRALKRMAMLAHDEYVKDPRRSVQEYYSERLAKLIEEAEVAFDAAHLQ